MKHKSLLRKIVARFLLVFVFTFCSAIALQGQSWTLQTSGTTQSLYGIHFLDANNGWAVGYNGTIRHTTNGGATWTAQTSGITDILYDVVFLDANNGFAVGEVGRVLKTTNGGANWTILGAPINFPNQGFYGIHFTSNLIGYIAGYNYDLLGAAIYKTTDGGSSWSLNYSSAVDYLVDIHFGDINTGYALPEAVDGGKFLKTTNSGTSWTLSTFSANTQHVGQSVFFTDANTGWIAGINYTGSLGLVYKTTNGGSSWVNQLSGSIPGFLSIRFFDANIGWVVGNNGAIYYTANGGTNWTLQPSGITGSSINDISIFNATTAWACGDLGKITKYTCTPSSITLGVSPTVCRGTVSASLPYTATTGTPDTYSIDYDAAANTAGFVDVVNAALPVSPITLTVPGAAAGGTYNATITVIKTVGGCVSPAVPFTITVSATNTVTLTSGAGTNNQTVNVNTAMTPITFSTTGATGISNNGVAGANGLPPGVTATWAGNIITINGTPSSAAGSPYNYSITLTGGCGTVTATGTITVTSVSTITVTTAIDEVNGNTTSIAALISTPGGAGISLREAIIAANNTAGANTILFSAALNGTPITLTLPGANENNSATGDLDIKDALTITGNGPSNTFVQAGTNNSNGIDKVFSINPSFTLAFATTITGITIRFGKNPSAYSGDGFGGGLDWEGSGTGTLLIDNCVITDNKTTDGDGGGLTVTNTGGGTGSVTITNSTISNNTPARAAAASPIGGGIFVGTTTAIFLTNCTISGNSVAGSAGQGQGGGIFIFGPGGAAGQSSLTNCIISNNTSPSDGGGIYSTTPLTINATTFSGNNSGRFGGGLFINHSNATTTISKNTFINNNATTRGGGIYLGTSTTSNILNVSYSRFAGNTSAAQNGVAIADGAATLQNNWWGCNLGPSNAACNQAAVFGTGSINFTPWLVLNHTASPTTICSGANSTFTASFLLNSSGGAVAATNLDVLIGQPITFNAPVNGTLSAAQATIQPSGTATVTFTGTTGGSGSANAVFVPAIENFTVTTNPTITVTAANTVTLTSGAGTNNQTATINTAMTPITFSTTGATGISNNGVAGANGLPPGVTATWAANVVTISGSPTSAAGSPYTYTVTLTGGCGTVTTTGTITVTTCVVALTSAPGTNAQTVCVNTPITNIFYLGDLFGNAANYSGLPPGVFGFSNPPSIYFISGTPTATGVFNYTVTQVGGACAGTIASGTITVVLQPTGPTLLANTPNLATICTGTGVSATFNAGSGGTGCADDYTVSIDGGAAVAYTPGSTVGAAATTSIAIQGRRANCMAGSGCTGTSYVTLASWAVVAQPVGPTLLAKTPNLATICTGTGVSATFIAGSGGTGCTDDFTVNIDGAGPIAYTPGSTVGATATTSIMIQGRRASCAASSGCTGTSYVTLASWTVVPQLVGPTLLAKFPSSPGVCIGFGVFATFNAGSGGTGCTDDYTVSIDGGAAVAYTPGTTVGAAATTSIVIQGRRANCGAGAGCTGTSYATLASWTVTPNNTFTLTSGPGTDAQTVVVNQPMAIPITYAITGAVTNLALILPPGLGATLISNVVTISGTPTALGSQPYIIGLNGGCSSGPLIQGTVNVVACSITLTSGAGSNVQTRCVNSPITNITYNTVGATGATFSDFPPGVTGTWASNVVSISGAPTAAGTYNYTVTLTGGGCGAFSASGTITVNPLPVVSIIPPGPTTICAGSNLTLTASATCNNFAFSGLLTGAQEVPANASTARGLFNGTYNGTTNQLTLNVVFNGLTGGNASAAHLHNAAPGAAGPVIIPFPGFPASTSGSYTNTFTMPPAQVANFLAGNTYINIHNATFPGGEIRGQVVNLVTNGYTIAGPMNGTMEVPPNASTATGNFAGTYNDVTNQVNINVIFNNLTGGNASAGHIHAAAPGVNGPVIIPFAGFPAATSGSYSLTATLPAANLAAFMAGNTYTNIHNAVFPGGEIRGQIAPPAAICASNTYLWSPGGATTQSITVSTANTYTVTVTDGNLCSGSASTVVMVNPTPTVNAVSNQVLCNGSSTTGINFSGALAGTVYNWTNNTPSIGLAANGSGNIASFTAINGTNTPLVATITVTPSYTNGGVTCAGTPIQFTITVSPSPAITLNAPVVIQPTCAVPTGTITVSATTASGLLEYSIDNGVTWQLNPTFNSLAFSSLAPGSYFVRVRLQGGSCSIAYTNNPIVLNVPTCPGKTIPGRIEAESFDAKNGPQYGVPTDDAGGGQHVIGITNGSWMDYNVLVTQAGLYTVTFRVATTQNNPQFQIKLGSTVLGVVNITNTGGWSNWQNVSVSNIALTAGSKTIRIQSVNNETCNFNWTDWVVAGANTAPTATAGPNQSIVQPASQVTLAGSGIANNGGSISSHVWSKFSGPAGGNVTDPNSYTTTVTALQVGTYVFRLTVTQDDNQTATSDVTIVVNPSSGKFIPGRVEAEAWDTKSGPQYAVPTSDAGGGQQVIGMNNGAWLDYNVNVTQTGAYTVYFRVATTQNNVQFQIKSGATVLATVNIPNTGGWDTWMSVPVTNVALTAGIQTLRIQQSSNESCNFNWMDWSLTGPTTAPTANAGPNQNIILPITQVTMAGSGTANNPGGFILSHIWSKLSGGTANITDPANYNTTITGLSIGTYVFRLTVNQNDGQTATADVTVTVGSIPAPTVNAGPPQTITLPTNSVTLAGSGAAGAGGTITHVWSKFSGGAATITDPNNYGTTVTGLAAGTYVFRLTVNQNDGQTAFSNVTIIVNPAAGNGKTIPGKVEAEAWDAKSGPQYAVPTGDAGGGQQVVGITNGSWLDYNVNVLFTGSYTVNFRIATTQNNAQFQVKSGATVLGTLNVPNTGGWDTWQTVALNNIALTAGVQIIRIQLSSNESCNFNWTDWVFGAPPIAPLTIAITEKENNGAISLQASVFPNPASSYFSLRVQTKSMEQVTVRIIDIAGRQVQQLKGSPEQAMRFGDNIVNGTYFVEVRQGAEKVVLKVLKQ